MSSPLSIFRKHQKVLLAVFGVIIMITFTVGSIITGYQDRTTTPVAEKSTVVTWKHGSLSERELRHMADAHNLVIQFLDQLAQRAMQAGGSPKGPGVRVTMDRFRGRPVVIDPGIPRSSTEQDLVRTMLLAHKAEQLGVKISDEAILEFLDQISDGTVQPRSQYGEILANATHGLFAQAQLFEQLRTELLAQSMRLIALNDRPAMAMSGVFALTPSTAWDYFNRLNRRVKAEVLPLRVEDFKSKVPAAPTEAQIAALYAEGKERYPHPEDPKPGFKRRHEIAFNYLKADFDEFLKREMAVVTPEQIKEYYEKNKNDFKVPEPPTAEPAKTEPTKTEPASTEPAKTEPKPVEGDSAASAASPAEQPKPADAPVTPKQPVNDDAKIDLEAQRPADDSKPAAEGKQSRSQDPRGSGSTMFVSFLADDSGAAAAEAAPKEAATPTEGTPAKEEPSTKQEPAAPDSPPATESAPAKEDAMPKEEPAPKQEPAPTPEATQPKEPATSDVPAPAGSEAKPESTAPASPEAAAKPVQYKPLEEVQEQIRRDLARPGAQEKMDQAIKAARFEIEGYYKQFVKWKNLSGIKPDLKEPTPPDPETLAAKHNLIAGETPLMNELEVNDFELGKAYEFDFERGVQISFAQIAYEPRVPLYQPKQIRAPTGNIQFLYWKVEEREPFVPELKDIRDEVVEAWKLKEALKLAQAEAERLAKQAPGNKPLKETLDAERAKQVVETNEFSWLTYGNLPPGYVPPMLSSVDGVESPGPEFMESVFALKPGQSGVAANRPHSFVYVVRVVSESPDEAQRRKQFVESGISRATFEIATLEQWKFLDDWYRHLEDEMKVTWKRPAMTAAESAEF